MGKKIRIYKKRLSSFLIYPVMAIGLFSGCVTPSASNMAADDAKTALIERMQVSSSPSETVVELNSSGSAPYTAFKLTDPLRIILDIMGKPGSDLSAKTDLNEGPVTDIRFEEGKTQAMTTRMVVNLAHDVDYKISAEENTIRITMTPTEEVVRIMEQRRADAAKAAQKKKEPVEAEVRPSEPRILIKPGPSGPNQILGIDFSRLEQGKSRLTVTTDKKVRYDLNRKGPKSLALKLYDITAPPLLLRPIDTRHFESALNEIKPVKGEGGKDVSLEIFMREMVPFHVKQSDEGLIMDFGRTSVTPPEKKLVPLYLGEAKTRPLAATQAAVPETPEGEPGKKAFKGEPMYLDFINADVTHILRLINEVSEDNIIWDPAIAGRKVSMILKDVPWNEALELILKNNDLAKRYVGDNILWITTKAKMKQILAEEEAETMKLQKKLEEEITKQEEKEKKAKEEEPLITEYLPVDFAKAGDIKGHITLTKRGNMSIDTRTNTIIIKDIASSIKEAKETVKQFDTPVKQIMIEARIVDASDDFSRDLGLQWVNNGIDFQKRETNAMSWSGTPLWASGNSASSFASGNDTLVAGSFTTNAPSNWSSNVNLSFARLSNNMLSGLGLDAALALAETESKAKVMSAPKVIAREGTAASISSGDSIIIPATENVASTTLDATLSLTVTPSAVSYNNFITLDISVTDDQAPSTSRLLRKAISTTLMIKSGETVVIGGIIKETTSNDETGVPVLKDIPGLGWLFKAQTKIHNKSELLIFITPTVLPSPVKTF